MIEVEGLSKRFGDASVVDGVTFAVAAGEVLALVGTSGSGKSTTLRLINRLIEPSAGTVRLRGVDTIGMRAEKLRREMGYVIQSVGLFPHWTVAENVAVVPRLLGWERARIASRVDELLDLFGLEPGEYRAKYPRELSGGQQQRVGVARALAGEPAVLLMDEPFGALDPITRTRLQEEFAAIQRRRGITVILVTHDLDEAFKLGDKVALMDRGRLLQLGTPESLIRSPSEWMVRQFVGPEERALRILSLHRVSEIMDAPEPGRWRIDNGRAFDVLNGAPSGRVGPADTLREALSAMVWNGAELLPVVENGGVVGQVASRRLREIGLRR
jgi:osmoprotectant transport system ATP-binding protein